MIDGVLHIPDSTLARSLTRAERRVLALIASGCTHDEAAMILHRSRPTIRSHIRHISIKLGTHRPALLAHYARITGIIKAEPLVVLPTATPQPAASGQLRRSGTPTPATARQRPR